MSVIDLLGYGVLWLLAAFIFGIVFGRAMADIWDDDETYDPEFAHFVEPITQAAKQERMAQSELYPRTNFDVEYVVPLSRTFTVRDWRQEMERRG